ncbi:MAG: hypothetical protein ACOCZK_05970 [Planctomycetota bacterium]
MRIAPSSLVFLGVVGAGSVFAMVASSRGWGLPRPARQPVSVREGSVRGASTSGSHYRSRYFIGGGFHGGK